MVKSTEEARKFLHTYGLIAAVALAFIPLNAATANITYLWEAGSSNWNNPGNWLPNGRPAKATSTPCSLTTPTVCPARSPMTTTARM